MKLFQPCIIFSVYQGYGEQDLENHLGILHELRLEKINAIDLDGKYKGRREVSILIDARHIKYALDIAKAYGQESILYLHADRWCELVDVATEERKPLGWLCSTSKENALGLENYSLNYLTQTYYIIEEQ